MHTTAFYTLYTPEERDTPDLFYKKNTFFYTDARFMIDKVTILNNHQL